MLSRARARSRSAHAHPCALRPGADGFTLVELVAVLALVGILAVVAVARTASTDTFRQHAAAEELAAALRHAHKRAIAGRGAVWVLLDPAEGRVRFCADAGCAQALSEPLGREALVFEAPAGTTLSVQPAGLASIAFDGLGRAGGGSGETTRVVLDAAGATATVVVWNETGLTETTWTNK